MSPRVSSPTPRGEEGVPPDLYRNVGPLGENGVQMASQDHRPPPAPALSKGQDVSDPVNANRVGPSRLQELCKGPGPFFFLKGRGRNLCQKDEIFLGSGIQHLDDSEGFLDAGMGHQLRHLGIEGTFLGRDGSGPGQNEENEESEEQVKSKSPESGVTKRVT